MSKRGPIKQMDHDNWDQEEEPEEPGVFNTATKEAMQKRVIKVAKRNIPPASQAVAGAFSGFAGFANASKTNSSFQLSKSPPKSAVELPSFSLSSTTLVGGTTGTTNGAPAPANDAMICNSEESVVTRKSSSCASMTTASGSGTSVSSAEVAPRNSDYFRKLKALNTNVASWISMHVSKNPCCILTPIFRDYEQYLAQLEKNYPSAESASKDSKSDGTSVTVTFKSNAATNNSIPDTASDEKVFAPGPMSFGGSKVMTRGNSSSLFGSAGNNFEKGDEKKFSNSPLCSPKQKGLFNFGSSNSDKCAQPLLGQVQSSPKPKGGFSLMSSGNNDSTKFPTNPFSPLQSSPKAKGGNDPSIDNSATKTNSPFGLQLSNTNATSSSTFKDFKFGFGNSSQASSTSSAVSSSPFSFAVGPTTQSVANNDAAEEEYVPPQAEANQIVEEDAFYTKRCKLFLKKDTGFTERGVGMLYLKKLDEKIQLLIRADTSLGNILLNIFLSSSSCLQRVGKNNVLFGCVPNPPIDPKVPDSTEPVTMMVRVKTEEDADELLGKMKLSSS